MAKSICGFDYKNTNRELRLEKRMAGVLTHKREKTEQKLQRVKKRNKFIVAATAILMPIAVIATVIVVPQTRAAFAHLGFYGTMSSLCMLGVLDTLAAVLLSSILGSNTSQPSNRVRELGNLIDTSWRNKQTLRQKIASAREQFTRTKRTRLECYPLSIRKKLEEKVPLTPKEESIRQAYIKRLTEKARHHSSSRVMYDFYEKQENKSALHQIMHDRLGAQLPKYING